MFLFLVLSLFIKYTLGEQLSVWELIKYFYRGTEIQTMLSAADQERQKRISQLE